jgi:ligand-binding SRPBCC domain-containing protein
MPIVEVRTLVAAPMELCFDLARDIDLHTMSAEGTDERAIAGITHGLIGPGEEVTWEATHLGVRQRLTSRITRFDRPRHFRDSQVVGPFRRFDHDHIFSASDNGVTTMLDVFEYESPFGWLGRCADACFLRAYMRRFLERRALVIKAAAEQRARL